MIRTNLISVKIETRLQRMQCVKRITQSLFFFNVIAGKLEEFTCAQFDLMLRCAD